MPYRARRDVSPPIDPPLALLHAPRRATSFRPVRTCRGGAAPGAGMVLVAAFSTRQRAVDHFGPRRKRKDRGGKGLEHRTSAAEGANLRYQPLAFGPLRLMDRPLAPQRRRPRKNPVAYFRAVIPRVHLLFMVGRRPRQIPFVRDDPFARIELG